MEDIFESELVDINEQLNTILEGDVPCDGIDELVEYYLFKKEKTDRRTLNVSNQLSDYGMFSLPTRLASVENSILNGNSTRFHA